MANFRVQAMSICFFSSQSQDLMLTYWQVFHLSFFLKHLNCFGTFKMKVLFFCSACLDTCYIKMKSTLTLSMLADVLEELISRAHQAVLAIQYRPIWSGLLEAPHKFQYHHVLVLVTNMVSPLMQNELV